MRRTGLCHPSAAHCAEEWNIFPLASNLCRTALRRRSRADRAHCLSEVPSESAEARALLSEEQQAVARAIRDLPDRQREALVLRYYLDMSEADAAEAMRVSRGAVKSATSRALAAIGRRLKEGES